MTFEAAKKILGAGPEEDPIARIAEFESARERIAEMVRSAPNETIALRYQDGLLEFDKALAAVREEAERRKKAKMASMMALVPSSVSGERVETKRPDFHLEKAEVVAGESGEGAAADGENGNDGSNGSEAGGGGMRFVVYAVLFVLIGGLGGGWIYYHIEADRREQVQEQLFFLENFGAKLVEQRSWEQASDVYAKMAELDPGSETALTGRRSIEFGMREEQEQFVGYWSGEALAAFEAGRLEDAAEAAAKVLERYPEEDGVVELSDKIRDARVGQLRAEWQEKIDAAVAAREWEQAEAGLRALVEELPGDSLIAELEAKIEAGKQQQARDLARARELAEAASLRDAGAFDAAALNWVREAVALAPDDQKIRELYEKLSSYTRTLRVPEDVATLAEALLQVRDKDRIVLGEGTFEGPVWVGVAVQIEGAGEGLTLVSANATEGPAITFGPGSSGASVAGVVFRQESFDAGAERFPGALVREAEVDFSDCGFVQASGHGLAVIDGGHARAVRCRFTGNGWDGAMARGKGSRLTVRECQADENFGHGYEIWDGAVAEIIDSGAKGNSRNGLLVDSAAERLTVSGNLFSGNREYGIVIGAGASGTVEGNRCQSNSLGGLLVRFAAISVRVEGNELEDNLGPGLILEQGLRPDIYTDNRTTSNRGQNIVTGVSFSESE